MQTLYCFSYVIKNNIKPSFFICYRFVTYSLYYKTLKIKDACHVVKIKDTSILSHEFGVVCLCYCFNLGML